MSLSKKASAIAPSLTLEITAKAKKLKEEGRPVISFAAGEPDFNTPDYIIAAAKKALDEGRTKYTPASGTVSLKTAIADKLKKDNDLDYKPSQIVISNGAKHALYNALAAILNPGDEVILPAPYWLTYPELIMLCDGITVPVQTSAASDFKITPAQLEAAINPKTKAIILNNPSNPTGAVYTKAELIALAAVLEKYPNVYIISDEIYEKLTYEDEYYSIAATSPAMLDRTIVVNGMSKTYSMTGWRIGYTASNQQIAKLIAGMQSHMTSNPNTMAQYATEAALTDRRGEEFLSYMVKTFDSRRKVIIAELEKIPQLSFIVPKGAFYALVGVEKLIGKKLGDKTIGSAGDFANLILEDSNVALIPCESFGAPGYVRLSYAISVEDIQKGLSNIAGFISKLT